MADDVILAKYRLELADFRKDMDSINKKFDAQGKQTQKQADGIGKQFKKLGGIIAGAFAVSKLIDFGKQVIAVTAEFQKMEAVLQNTLGSNSAAKKAMDDIVDFASKTPFQVAELTDAFVKLANQGFQPTMKEMTKLGDLAASTGKTFDQLAEAVIDGQVGEFERLKEFGIRAAKEGDKVTFTFKGVKEQVDFTDASIRKYILSLGDAAGVSGSMDKISKTLGGQLSNLKDNFDQMLLAIGGSASGIAGGVVGGIASMVSAFTDLISLNPSQELKKERDELNILVGAILDTNEKQGIRNELIKKLNQEYPDFLKSMGSEELTNKNIAIRLAQVNDQFAKKIQLELVAEKLKPLQQESLDILDEEIEARKEVVRLENEEWKLFNESKKLRKEKGKNNTEYLIAESARKQAIELLANANEKVLELENKRAKADEKVAGKQKEYTDALNLFTDANADYFKQLEGGNSVVVDTNAELDNQVTTLATVTDHWKAYFEATATDKFTELKGNFVDVNELLEKANAKELEYIELQTLKASTAINILGSLGGVYTALAGKSKETALFELGLSQALSIVYAVEASLKAAKNSPFPVLTQIATFAQLAAVTAANFSQAKGIINSSEPPKYYEGTEYLTGAKGKDQIPILANYGERIIPTLDNAKIGRDLSNKELVDAAVMYKAFKRMGNQSGIDYQRMDKIERKGALTIANKLDVVIANQRTSQIENKLSWNGVL